MIPYSILGLKLIWAEDSLDVRVTDPVVGGVSFRVAKNRIKQLEEKPAAVRGYFLDYAKGTYTEVEVTDFQIEGLENSNFTLTTENTDFTENTNRVLKDYSNYIRIKTENDELEAMEEMTGLSCDSFSADYDEWAEKQLQFGTKPYRLKKVELAISLDEPEMWNSFLSLDWEVFQKFYWKKNHLDRHPMSNQKITHVYIGNQFCGHLFPERETLAELMEKIEVCELTPVIALSTMPEYMAAKYGELLSYTNEYGRSRNQVVEVVINDLGTALLSIDKTNLKFTLGILLNKRKKDPRLAFRTFDEAKAVARESSIDLPEYREYLKSAYGIETFSYEACGYEYEMAEGAILHLPLFQTNTAGKCTMKAILETGLRGKQSKTVACDFSCEGKHLMYPDVAHMIGRWNSLFGCSMREIDDGRYLLALIDNGVKRLVVRF